MFDWLLTTINQGQWLRLSGCGSVVAAGASKIRDLKFKSSHRQIYLLSTALTRAVLKRRK